VCSGHLEAVQEITPIATLSSRPGLPSGLARLDRVFDFPQQHVGILVDFVRGMVPMPFARLDQFSPDVTAMEAPLAKRLCPRLVSMSQVKLVRQSRPGEPDAADGSVPQSWYGRPGRFKMLGLVQHMTASFLVGFASWRPWLFQSMAQDLGATAFGRLLILPLPAIAAGVLELVSCKNS
jgi:hypothetical protein